jgi:hypothetical protein
MSFFGNLQRRRHFVFISKNLLNALQEVTSIWKKPCFETNLIVVSWNGCFILFYLHVDKPLDRISKIHKLSHPPSLMCMYACFRILYYKCMHAFTSWCSLKYVIFFRRLLGCLALLIMMMASPGNLVVLNMCIFPGNIPVMWYSTRGVKFCGVEYTAVVKFRFFLLLGNQPVGWKPVSNSFVF